MIDCILLSTPKRIEWLKKSIDSIDLLDYKFNKKILSVDIIDDNNIDDDIKLLAALNSKDDIKQLAKQHGWDDKKKSHCSTASSKPAWRAACRDKIWRKRWVCTTRPLATWSAVNTAPVWPWRCGCPRSWAWVCKIFFRCDPSKPWIGVCTQNEPRQV